MPSPLPSSRRTHAGYTLLEVMLMVAVVTLLISLTTFTFQRSLSSQQVNSASLRLSGDLTHAAQVAIARNQTVALVLLRKKDLLADEGAELQFRGWQLQAVNPISGVLEPISGPEYLDAGIIFMNHVGYSSVLHRPRVEDEPWTIRFKPGGGTDLPTGPDQHWCLTLARESDVAKDPSVLPINSRTLVVNAHTGMVTAY